MVINVRVPASGLCVHIPLNIECGMFVMCYVQCCMSVSTVLLCVDVLSR